MAFGQVLGTIGSMLPETEAIFETDLLAKQHPELILEQAREVLMLRNLHALREINTLRAAAEARTARTLELEEETRRDAMTGVYNRAYLDQFLAREFDHSSRHKWPLSVAFAISTTSRASTKTSDTRRAIGSCRRPRASCAAIPARPT